MVTNNTPITPSATPAPSGWGVVPTVGADFDTAIPNPITGLTPVRTAQSAASATASAAQVNVLPPAPTWSPIIDLSGAMTASWITWFQVLGRKLGGYASTPTDDAQVLAYEPERMPRDTTAEILAGFEFPRAAAPVDPPLWDESSVGWVRGQKYLASVVASAPLSGLGTVASPLTLPGVLSITVGATSLTAGMWVNIYNSAVRPADSTDATKPAQGFVLAGFSSGATATVYLAGINSAVPVGAYVAADLGKPVFLSTSGGTTLTPPATTGNLLQQVGWVDAVGTAVTVNFINSPGIVRA